MGLRKTIKMIRKTKKLMKKLCGDCKQKAALAVRYKQLDKCDWCKDCRTKLKSLENVYDDKNSKKIVEKVMKK